MNFKNSEWPKPLEQRRSTHKELVMDSTRRRHIPNPAGILASLDITPALNMDQAGFTSKYSLCSMIAIIGANLTSPVGNFAS